MRVNSPFVITLAAHCELQSVHEAIAAQRRGALGLAYAAHSKYLQGLLGAPAEAVDLYCLGRIVAAHRVGVPPDAVFLAEARTGLSSMIEVCS
jgi:hypothetical protein